MTELKNKGHQIFLDLKLHDIPNTVQKALHNLINLRPDYISIHLLGGKKMVKGAQQVCDSSDTKLIGVSILTSLSQRDLEQILSNKISLSNNVKTLVKLAQDSGLTNIVCSAQEAYVVKQSFPEMTCFCPGIRLEAEHGDQKRIVSPGEAQNLQADYIIVGREIIKNKEPYKHYLKIKKAFMMEKKSNLLTIKFAGQSFQTPLLAGAGVFGYGDQLIDWDDLNRWGGIVLKGLTLKPCAGNPHPRIYKSQYGLINSIGLRNPGWTAFMQSHHKQLSLLKTHITVNISGTTEAELVQLARKLTKYLLARWLNLTSHALTLLIIILILQLILLVLLKLFKQSKTLLNINY